MLCLNSFTQTSTTCSLYTWCQIHACLLISSTLRHGSALGLWYHRHMSQGYCEVIQSYQIGHKSHGTCLLKAPPSQSVEPLELQSLKPSCESSNSTNYLPSLNPAWVLIIYIHWIQHWYWLSTITESRMGTDYLSSKNPALVLIIYHCQGKLLGLPGNLTGCKVFDKFHHSGDLDQSCHCSSNFCLV